MYGTLELFIFIFDLSWRGKDQAFYTIWISITSHWKKWTRYEVFFSKDEYETLWDITVRNILILLNYKNDTQNYGQILNKYFVDWSSKDKIFLLLNSVSGSQRPWVISTQNTSRTINNIWVFCHFSFQQKHWLWIIQFPLVSILSRGGGINCDAD